MITRKNTIINAESERKLDKKLNHYQSTYSTRGSVLGSYYEYSSITAEKFHILGMFYDYQTIQGRD